MNPKGPEKLIASIPDEPGVYLMLDSTGTVIYIGKALSLKKRVSSYFSNKDQDPKTTLLVRLIDSIDFIVTDNEIEALILENSLIKKHKPRFNVRLKDDKSYPYIGVTFEEKYPRVIYTRNIRRGRNRYFGPYTDAASAKMIVAMINDIFRLKRCRRPLPLPRGERPCLNYQIRKCSGLCTGDISTDEYLRMIDNAVKFLEGDSDSVKNEMRKQMKKYSDEMNYEKASVYRDILLGIQSISEKQNVHDHSGIDRDYAAVRISGEEAAVLIFEFRSGVLIGKKIIIMSNTTHASIPEILENFTIDYYSRSDIPSVITLPELPAGQDLLQKFLTEKSGKKVKINTARSSEARGIIALIEKNADILLAERESRRINNNTSEALHELEQKIPGLDRLPERIECFDISNLQGSDAVASMVSFRAGVPDKSAYRRFKIRGQSTPDDPAMIHEAVARRVQRLYNEGKKMPDLILIDGGPAQLKKAIEAAANFTADSVIISIAKRFEEIYFDPGSPPLSLSLNSGALKMLQSLRDEAHRFAVTYHRHLRDKKTVKSDLDEIPDIGPAVKRILLSNFKSVDRIKTLSIDELASVKGIGEKTARKIYEFFNKFSD